MKKSSIIIIALIAFVILMSAVGPLIFFKHSDSKPIVEIPESSTTENIEVEAFNEIIIDSNLPERVYISSDIDQVLEVIADSSISSPVIEISAEWAKFYTFSTDGQRLYVTLDAHSIDTTATRGVTRIDIESKAAAHVASIRVPQRSLKRISLAEDMNYIRMSLTRLNSDSLTLAGDMNVTLKACTLNNLRLEDSHIVSAALNDNTKVAGITSDNSGLTLSTDNSSSAGNVRFYSSLTTRPVKYDMGKGNIGNFEFFPLNDSCEINITAIRHISLKSNQ